MYKCGLWERVTVRMAEWLGDEGMGNRGMGEGRTSPLSSGISNFSLHHMIKRQENGGWGRGAGGWLCCDRNPMVRLAGLLVV